MMSIIKSIYNKKIFSLLAVIELIFAIYVLAQSIGSYRYITSNIRNVNKYFDINRTIVGNVATSDNFIKYYKSLAQDSTVKDIGLFDSEYSFSVNKNDSTINNNIFKFLESDADRQPYIDDNTTMEMHVTYIDEEFSKWWNIQVISGRSFKSEDFIGSNNKYVPILAGNSYKNVLKAGDTIKGTNGAAYKVIGILKNNVLMPTGVGNFTDGLRNLDKYFVGPLNINVKSDLISNFNIIVSNNNGTDTDLFFNNMKNNLRNLNVNFEIMQKLSEDVACFKDLWKYSINKYFIKTITILILITIGIVMFTSMDIVSRKREIGILIACGATKFNVITKVFGEIVLDFGAAAIMALSIFIYQVNKYNMYIYNMDYISVTIALAIVMILSIISSILPAAIVLRMQPKDMIGGTE